MYTLTGKYDEIVDQVYQYRFINRHQLQKILKHKGPRRVNSWLKELTEEGFLGRIYSNKLLENTKPAIYYLSNKGISVIKHSKKLSISEIKKFYEDKNRSHTFIDHCITASELLLSMKVYENEKQMVKLYPKETLVKDHYLSELKPDGYIKIYQKKTKKSKEWEFYNSYILNIIDPGVPRYAIRYRVTQYIEFHEEETWKEHISKFPSVIMVFPTKQKQGQFAKYIKQQLDEGLFTQGLVFLLTTYEKAMEDGLSNEILQYIQGE